MSSFHQDNLLAEGPKTAPAAGSPLTPDGGASRRRTAEKVPNGLPTQRKGTGEPPAAATGAAGMFSARAQAAKKATGRAASGRAVTAASVRAATAKAATATSKAANAAAAAAVAKVTSRTSPAKKAAAGRHATTVSKAATAAAAAPAPSAVAEPVTGSNPPVTEPVVETSTVRQAMPSVGRHAAAEPEVGTSPVAQLSIGQLSLRGVSIGRHAAGKRATARPVRARGTARPARTMLSAEPAPVAAVLCPARGDRPLRERTPALASVVASEVLASEVLASEVLASEVVASEVLASEVVASVAAGRAVGVLRRRAAAIRRRPALYLAAALVGSLGISVLSTAGPAAHATVTMSSVSVAHELGIDSAATDAVIDPAGTQRLEELAVSRKARDADQAAAAQAQAQADQAAAAAAAAAAEEAARPQAVLPVNGARLTSGFGGRWGTLHAGIDLAAAIGTPEYAVMDGVVLKAGPASGFGLAVYIQHQNGDVTVYGHMEKILVETGEVVKAGEQIALLGNLGQSTGPHLHFEVHEGGLNGQKVDPLPWLRARGLAI